MIHKHKLTHTRIHTHMHTHTHTHAHIRPLALQLFQYTVINSDANAKSIAIATFAQDI